MGCATIEIGVTGTAGVTVMLRMTGTQRIIGEAGVEELAGVVRQLDENL